MADISNITLPNGVTYYFKDETARAALAAGLSCTIVDSLPADAAEVTQGTIYLIASDRTLTGDSDNYDEYLPGTDTQGKLIWEQIGNTDIDLSGYSKTGHTHNITSNVSIASHQYTPAGTNKASSVTFGTPDTSTVVTSSLTATAPATTVTSKYLTAKLGSNMMTNASVPSGSSTAISSITENQRAYVKSYPGSFSKLNTTSVPNMTSVGSAGTAASWSATYTASTENLKFNWTTNTPTTPATLGTAVTAATGGLSTGGSGSQVMVGLGTAVTAKADYSITPSTNSNIKIGDTSFSCSTPAVAYTTATSSSTGSAQYVESLATSSSSTNAVTFNTAKDNGYSVDAYTALPSATAEAQTFTGTKTITQTNYGGLSHTVTNPSVVSGESSK